jgi:hypothetical protein
VGPKKFHTLYSYGRRTNSKGHQCLGRINLKNCRVMPKNSPFPK